MTQLHEAQQKGRLKKLMLLLRKRLLPPSRLKHLQKLWMTPWYMGSSFILQRLVSWTKILRHPMRQWLMKLNTIFKTLHPSSLQLQMRLLLEIRANMMLLLFILPVSAPLLSTLHNQPLSLTIKYKIWLAKPWRLSPNANGKRINNLSVILLQNIQQTQMFMLVVVTPTHVPQPPPIPASLDPSPTTLASIPPLPSSAPPPVQHWQWCPSIFLSSNPFLLMTKEGEIGILIVIKINKLSWSSSIFVYVLSLVIICCYSTATFIIFYICHFLAMIELMGSLTTLHSHPSLKTLFIFINKNLYCLSS